ncbi:MAG: HAD family hydrolase [Anaerolineales bacterium]
MPPSILRAVIFDLGGTLMHERDATHPVNARGDEALTLFLQEQGLELNLSTFPVEFRRRLDEYFKQREKDLLETTYSFVLRDVLTDKGYGDVSDEIIRSALDKLFAVTQTNWLLEEDTISTLKKVEEDGYRMGLISNAGDDKDVQQLLHKFGIGHFFDFALTSAGCSYRKPHPRIFELALSNWYFLPAEAVMIGDNLDADIRGAKEAGLGAIWIKRRAVSQGATQPQGQPDAVVSSLAEIPAALDRLQVR